MLRRVSWTLTLLAIVGKATLQMVQSGVFFHSCPHGTNGLEPQIVFRSTIQQLRCFETKEAAFEAASLVSACACY
jgi:hypothetical protein